MTGEQQGGQTTESRLMSDEQRRATVLCVICEPFNSSEYLIDIGGGADARICGEAERQWINRLLAANSWAAASCASA